MDIKIIINNGHKVLVEAENVRIEEDIEKRHYDTDFKVVKVDIDTKFIDKISNVMSDLIDYRHERYDSLNLIYKLIDKLPIKKRDEIAKHLGFQSVKILKL